MRRAAAAVALLWSAAALAFAVPPKPGRFFHDGTGTISSSDRYRIEERLMQLNREGLQIGVAVLPSLDGEAVEDATLRIAEAWRPGSAAEDDGALIAVFMNDRKMRIEVGYGLEAKIPDVTARRIIQEQMRPAFQARQFADGILRAIDAVAARALGRQPPPPAAAAYPSSRGRGAVGVNTRPGCGAACPCLFMILVFWFMGALRRATRPRNLGWGHGRRHGTGGMPWWAWLLIGNATARRSSGWSSGRSSWGGGGGGGGSFGGGSFGGGGASGSW